MNAIELSPGTPEQIRPVVFDVEESFPGGSVWTRAYRFVSFTSARDAVDSARRRLDEYPSKVVRVVDGGGRVIHTEGPKE